MIGLANAHVIFSTWLITSNYRQNMPFQLENGLVYIKHCLGVYDQNSLVNIVHVDDWIAELVIIVRNDLYPSAKDLDISYF